MNIVVVGAVDFCNNCVVFSYCKVKERENEVITRCNLVAWSACGVFHV